ncbi:MAG: hypothetical protein K2Q12_03985 [Rickettsiales bacterium]|nr:hypothetical protein [Rickettsiales bacterium]
MIDTIAYGLRWLAAFITGRGAATLAVAGAVGAGIAFGSPWLPIIGLAVGIPVTAALATMSHDHAQKQLRTSYREEVAAVLGIAPREVTMDHLRSVARGIPEQNIPGNLTLHQALERNDRHRTIAVVSNVVAAMGATAIIAALHFLAIPSALANFFTEVTPWLGIGTGSGAEAAVLAGTAAISGIGLDYGFNRAGRRMFGDDSPSLAARIERISHMVRRGQSVGTSPIMALVAEANGGVDQEIRQRYGLPYHQLPAEQQRDVIQHYDGEFQLKDSAEAISLGLMPAQELAFLIEGRRSGAVPTATTLVQAYHSELDKAKAQGIHIPAPQEHVSALQRVPGLAQAQRFVDRVRGHAPDSGSPARNHVERLEQQASSSSPNVTLH